MARGAVGNAQPRVPAPGGGARGRVRQPRGRGKGAPAPLPWDSQAQRESDELGNEAADTRATLGAKLSGEQNTLGLGPAAGNPYGKSTENKEAEVNNARGITNTAGNQLYAGSTANRQRENQAAYDRSQKAIEQAYAEDEDAYTRGTVQTAREEALGDAAIREGAVTRAAATTPAPEAVPTKRPTATGRGRGRVGPGNNVKGNNRGRGRV